MIGVVQARDIAAALFRGEPLDLRALMRKAPVVPDQIDAMDALVRAARAPRCRWRWSTTNTAISKGS